MAGSMLRKIAGRTLRELRVLPDTLIWGPLGGYSAMVRLRRSCSRYMFSRWAKGDHTWYDHRIDELDWPKGLYWVERGVLGTMHLKPGDKALDCCCGDGYFSGTFWAPIAESIDAVDRDQSALAMAKKAHGAQNIRFTAMDIVKDAFPGVEYDIVFFYEAIEHLSAEAGRTVLEKIHAALKPGGLLVGSTPLVRHDYRGKGNREHDNEFESAEDLQAFLAPTFADVTVMSSFHPSRTTLYFICKRQSGSSGD